MVDETPSSCDHNSAPQEDPLGSCISYIACIHVHTPVVKYLPCIVKNFDCTNTLLLTFKVSVQESSQSLNELKQEILRSSVEGSISSDSTFITKASSGASCRTLPGALEYTPRDTLECTSGSYKKVQEKRKQQILKASLQTSNDKIRHLVYEQYKHQPEKGKNAFES